METGLPAAIMRLILPPILLVFGLVAHSVAAQPGASVFEKAPPVLDEALRKRATAFYQAHVDGKTRQAMALVAEEAADAFFDMQKPKLMSFEIQQVKYGKGFKEASVLVLAEREVAVPFGGLQVMKVPMESYWKQVGKDQGTEWRWFIPKSDCKDTPFGCVPTTGSASAEEAKKIKERLSAIGSMPKLDGEFGFDRNMLEMGSGDEAELTFKNGFTGYVSLKYLEPFNDPEVELVGAEQQVPANSSVKVVVRVKKGVKISQARQINVPLYVQPFNRSAGLRVLLHP